MQQKNKEGRRAYCWKITKNLRDKDEPKLMNLGGKRMKSTKLHSLLRDAGRRNGSGSFGLQRWRARKRIKEGEKPGGDLSKAGATDGESNVEHMQTSASSNERGKPARTPGLGNRGKERKRIEYGR